MKSIILFRHGRPKSSYIGEDHDRPLSPRGISDAKKMGIYLSNKNNLPDLVISSPALRAKTTAEFAMAEGKWSCSIELAAGIYGGLPSFLLNLAKKQDNFLSSICLVGHEPNFSNFISWSTGDDYKRFPKASMAKIDFDVEMWENIAMGFGSLDWLIQVEKVSD